MAMPSPSKSGGGPTSESKKSSSLIPDSLIASGISKDAKPLRNEFLVTNPFRDQMPKTLMARPRFFAGGKAAKVSLNSHKILSYPSKPVYQYDILIGTGAEKRGLVKSVWESKGVQGAIGKGFIFDGNKIGWTISHLAEEIRLLVDLDQERGIAPREGRVPNQHRVLMKRTNVVDLNAINTYLSGETGFGPPVLEAINFLDHLLRETPSKVHISQKRSYFGRETPGDRCILGGGIEAMKGVYQSIRAAEGKRLVVNVDVSNTTFWHETAVSQLAYQITGAATYLDMINMIQPIKATAYMPAHESPYFAALRRLHKNEIKVRFRGAGEAILKKTFKIDRITSMTARSQTFDMLNKQTGVTEKNVSVESYFRRRYNIELEWPTLPLVEVNAKGTMYPMELCFMTKGQKYPFKLDEIQTSKMIKFAVSRPAERKKAIQVGLKMLDWKQDSYLQHYGLEISPDMLSSNARVLEPPNVEYRNGSLAKPGFSGRWDLRNKLFLKGNPAPLQSWGISLMGKTPPPMAAVQAYVKTFIQVYRGHGGVVENEKPVVLQGGLDAAAAVSNLFNTTGNACQLRPQLFLFVLAGKNAETYARIKKSADCRYGIVSQCVQGAHLLKNQIQYHSNVCMKINAKLGGTTCRVALKSKGPQFTAPTMIIGGDVSHASPGSNSSSFASMTVSMDRLCARYAAAVESNGDRVEILTTKTIEDMLKPLIEHWCEEIGEGRLPKHVYYFRDGVSEGQYNEVLRNEVADIKQIFAEFGKYNPQHEVLFTVVVAEKRHHIRFFPTPGIAADRNGNPVPGVLVERDVTHPFQYDFYLCSHSAIQGTARPTHYHVLMDECRHDQENFQKMIYEHCYQYQRATTPVSVFPAIYYAHLASNRARSHLDKAQTKMIEERRLEKKGLISSEQQETETKPLIPMANNTFIRYSMWYI